MRFKFVAAILVASCLPAMAESLPVQGSLAVVSGVAHVHKNAEGTYIEIENPDAARSVGGFIPFGDQSSFSNLSDLDGRTVQIAGVVGVDGQALISLTDPDQLTVVN
jgi:hypothetical protein